MLNLIKHLTVLIVLFGFFNFISTKKEADIKHDVAPHVVAWKVIQYGNDRFASGFHLKYNGDVYIVTNKHVCDSNKEIYGHDYIQFDDYVGEVIAIDTQHDLCLVTSNRDDGLELAQGWIKPLDEIILVGFPRGIGMTVREGRIIGEVSWVAPWINTNIETVSYQVSTQAYGGNSGSPVVDKYGKVVGVLFAGIDMYPGEPFVVPDYFLFDFLERTLGE